jgi:hypothetical protein
MTSVSVPSLRTKRLASSPAMNSSITTEAPAAPKAPPRMSSMAACAFGLGHGDDHALAGGEAIGLDHDRRACASIWAWAAAASVKRAQAAVGAPQASQTSFVKVLELSSRAAAFRGAEYQKTGLLQDIHSPVLKWGFRAYNYERNAVFLAEREKFSIVENINIRTFRDFGDPGIPGRDDQPVAFRVLQNGPGQRVFAPAAAEDENVHGRPPVTATGVAEASVGRQGGGCRIRGLPGRMSRAAAKSAAMDDLIDDDTGGGPPGNTPEFTVSEISGAVKRTIEGTFARVRVRGEIGRLSRPRSGHVYLDLKDDRSVLASVIWKGVAARLAHAPEEGMEVSPPGG